MAELAKTDALLKWDARDCQICWQSKKGILFLEIKGSNGKLSLKQQEMIALLNKVGLNGVVAKAVWSLDEVVDLIEQFKK